MRKIGFVNEEYHHIFNRGVEKREIFSCDEDYLRFLKSMKEFNVTNPIGSLYEKHLREKKFGHNGHLMSTDMSTEKLVDIICFCLNPNHYHLILKQLQEKGIEKFMQRLGNGYTKYYNHKYSRSGVLFQGVFKSVYIDSNEQLLYLSAYVNKNHFIHKIKGTFDVHNGHQMSKDGWPYSSLSDYLGKRKESLCSTEPILGQFRDAKEYKKFVQDNALHMKEKKEMEKYILE